LEIKCKYKNNYSLVEKILGANPDDSTKIISAIKSGLPYSVIEILTRELKISNSLAGDVLLISAREMNEISKLGNFKIDQSDRIIRLARAFDCALGMMSGDADAAATWMLSPRDVLGGESPLQHLQTEIGAREVEDLIGRIQHGVFS
jgi:putative toxin-antitoxin system antitoxin component (TIGR02293 family)